MSKGWFERKNPVLKKAQRHSEAQQRRKFRGTLRSSIDFNTYHSSMIKKAAPPPRLQSLIQEARKCKSAEEFVSKVRGIMGIPLVKMNKQDFQNWVGNENVVKGKIKVYRGINIPNAKLRLEDFLAVNKEYARSYGKYIYEYKIPIEELGYFSGVKSGDPKLVGQTLTGAQPTELIWHGGLQTQTKSQLINFYDQAVKGLRWKGD